MIAIGILVCLITESRYPDIHRAVHPLESSLVGVNLAQFAVGVLGVLTITAEYSTGMIRSSFCAVPKRLPVLWAKALVFAVVTFVISLPSILIAFFVGQSILSGKHIDVSISHPGVLRSLIGAALFLAVMGLLGLGLGAIIRTTAGGISALVAMVFVIPPILELALAGKRVQRDQRLPPAERRRCRLDDQPGGPHAFAVGRLCGVLRIRRGCAGDRRRTASPTRRLTRGAGRRYCLT